MQLDLTDPVHAYLFGFIQGDGSLYQSARNLGKGRLRVELSIRDRDLIDRFHALFPDSTITYRDRSTNFSDDYHGIVWSVCRQDFRRQLEMLGMPVGRKSYIVKPPTATHREIDYWRGMIDADGSLGLTKERLPFLSLVTVSVPMAQAYMAFLYSLTGKQKTSSPNVRDRAFNIALFREDAVSVVNALYYDGCLCLDRKREKASLVKAWTRPASMRQKTVADRPWSTEEDQIVLTRAPIVAQQLLGRSRSSVSCRKARLIAARQPFVIKDNDQSAEGAA